VTSAISVHASRGSGAATLGLAYDGARGRCWHTRRFVGQEHRAGAGWCRHQQIWQPGASLFPATGHRRGCNRNLPRSPATGSPIRPDFELKLDGKRCIGFDVTPGIGGSG